jgi:hypothetical protein
MRKISVIAVVALLAGALIAPGHEALARGAGVVADAAEASAVEVSTEAVSGVVSTEMPSEGVLAAADPVILPAGSVADVSTTEDFVALDGTSDFTISMAAPHTDMVVTPMIITTTDALIRIASSAR